LPFADLTLLIWETLSAAALLREIWALQYRLVIGAGYPGILCLPEWASCVFWCSISEQRDQRYGSHTAGETSL